ncbi:MAG: class I SAM-dependent methyltransferase [bacterium]|nr:class I SAM-dependent methyltransferase [bacterium]
MNPESINPSVIPEIGKYNANFYKDYYSEINKTTGFGTIDKEKVTAILKFVTGDKILDIGCGKGQYVSYLNSLDKLTYGMDFVKEFLPSGQQNVVCGNIMQIPFKKNSFDTSILFDVLEHTDDEKVLTEAARVTKNRIIATVPMDCNNWFREFYLTYANYIDKTHLRYYTEEKIDRLFKKCGLKVIALLPHLTVDFNRFTVSAMEPKGGIINKLIFRFLPYAKFKCVDTAKIIIADKI